MLFDEDELPEYGGNMPVPTSLCDQVNEKITAAEQDWCCRRQEEIEKLASISDEFLATAETREARFNAATSQIRLNYGIPAQGTQSIRDRIGPESPQLETFVDDDVYQEYTDSITRAWIVFDAVVGMSKVRLRYLSELVARIRMK